MEAVEPVEIQSVSQSRQINNTAEFCADSTAPNRTAVLSPCSFKHLTFQVPQTSVSAWLAVRAAGENEGK